MYNAGRDPKGVLHASLVRLPGARDPGRCLFERSTFYGLGGPFERSESGSRTPSTPDFFTQLGNKSGRKRVIGT